MEKQKLNERREKVLNERKDIEDKIEKARKLVADANGQIDGLVGLLNVNMGILSEIDYQINHADGEEK